VEIVRDGAAAETFTVESAEQILVPWPAWPLASRERADVRVRVRDAADWSAWSPGGTIRISGRLGELASG
jgi:alpha-L-rhamnosidase